MKRKQFLTLVDEGENLRCEFKLRFSSHEKIAKEIIAFANTKGGYILFGVDDDKNIVGVESEKSETELILETINNYCEPPVNHKIEFIEHNGREVVILEIFEAKEKPHRTQDYKNDFDINSVQVYVRINDKSVLASKEMIRVLRSQTKNQTLKKYFIGTNEKIVFDYLNKYEKITVKTLSNIANMSQRRASRTLVKMVRADLLFIHTDDKGEDFFTLAS